MYLSAAEARERLRVSQETLRRLIKSGELKAHKVGSGITSPYRISEDDIADYIKRQQTVAAAS